MPRDTLRPIMYTPSGKAGEYADHGYAVKLYRGCNHSCHYCYAKISLHMTAEAFHGKVTPANRAIERLKRDLARVGKVDENIFMSFTTDPYNLLDEEMMLTRKAIIAIRESGNHVTLLTKNGDLGQRDFDLLGIHDKFGVTLTCEDDLESLMWEPQASRPTERIVALQNAYNKGIGTWVSCEPIIRPSDTITLIKQVSPYADVIKVGKLNYPGGLPDAFQKLVQFDWKKVALDIHDTINDLPFQQFYIKDDLAAFLPAGSVKRRLGGGSPDVLVK